jgi:hypothetical protein
VGVPLESFIVSARTVGGAALVMLARGTAFALRLAANLVRNLARVLITLYDIVIVLPLMIERLVKVTPHKKAAAKREPEDLAIRERP